MGPWPDCCQTNLFSSTTPPIGYLEPSHSELILSIMSHNDQTIVLITGANQGIGFEIAKKLGTDHHDYHIIVTGRKAQAVDIAAAKLLEAGCSVEPLLLDLTMDESIAQAAKTVGEKHGRLDVLINNAGISTENIYNPQKPYTRQAWAAMYDTNVIGTSAVTEAFIPLLEKSKKTKRIVFISTNMGSMALRKHFDLCICFLVKRASHYLWQTGK
jgi:NAD(P)-dependent dehydrogenase (short-subunit alcohol dehydrogenase family)